MGDPEELFASAVYDRGAMTLQALRQKVGDDVFFGILRAWYAENRYGNVTTADFVALSERESGQQLDSFFDVWLYRGREAHDLVKTPPRPMAAAALGRPG